MSSTPTPTTPPVEGSDAAAAAAATKERARQALLPFLRQITAGCGNASCKSSHCATTRPSLKLLDQEAKARVLSVLAKSGLQSCVVLSPSAVAAAVAPEAAIAAVVADAVSTAVNNSAPAAAAVAAAAAAAPVEWSAHTHTHARTLSLSLCGAVPLLISTAVRLSVLCVLCQCALRRCVRRCARA